MNFHFFSDFESMSTEGFELIKKEIEKKQDWLYDQQRLAITR